MDLLISFSSNDSEEQGVVFFIVATCHYFWVTQIEIFQRIPTTYRKIVSSNTSRIEAHVGFLRLLMKEIFGPYVP